jgi:hypothetical protein
MRRRGFMKFLAGSPLLSALPLDAWQKEPGALAGFQQSAFS